MIFSRPFTGVRATGWDSNASRGAQACGRACITVIHDVTLRDTMSGFSVVFSPRIDATVKLPAIIAQ
jgi:hypothetical protein